ncbi:Cys-tRNA(Pro) deacylase [Kurthia huakuii]|uniref:Cys-tRNA(Pro) deacylase n=1 Tax=Kurthia huakuii TaxID=1421019 RepID=UPI000498562D|nr:Cys-tRNA(Pro) deacylase [Kurthia huakuii]MBM7698951.1 Cys-tRNA(Pro)/Cys-tRNA(Cys) deacylase [Kurthia huakuii]
MAKQKMQKTNAVRLLDQQKIPYHLQEYAVNDDHLDGVTAANEVGQPVEKVFKTLVAKSTKGQLYVFVIPVAKELDLKKAAKAVHEKKIEMLHVKDLLANTGYIRGGCSPIGMKKHYPTYIDSDVQLVDEVLVSAGKRGMQLCLTPDNLVAAAKAEIVNITVDI